MTLAEYEELLADLVTRHVITMDEAKKLRQMFINGEINEDELPLPVVEATKRDDNSWLLAFLIFIVKSRSRVSLSRRRTMRNVLMRQFDLTIGELANRAHNIREWHSELLATVGGAMLASWYVGNGQADNQNIDEHIDLQLGYMYRFAADVHARQALGDQYSLQYLANRSLLYGGAVWGSWFRGNESIGDGTLMAQYIAVDDRRTCSPCRQAVGIYPLNSGPFPGEICYGGGRCRCERIIITV